MELKGPKISLKTPFGWGENKSFTNKMNYYSPPMRNYALLRPI